MPTGSTGGEKHPPVKGLGTRAISPRNMRDPALFLGLFADRPLRSVCRPLAMPNWVIGLSDNRASAPSQLARRCSLAGWAGPHTQGDEPHMTAPWSRGEPQSGASCEGSTPLSLNRCSGGERRTLAVWPHKRLAATGLFAIGSRPGAQGLRDAT